MRPHLGPGVHPEPSARGCPTRQATCVAESDTRSRTRRHRSIPGGALDSLFAQTPWSPRVRRVGATSTARLWQVHRCRESRFHPSCVETEEPPASEGPDARTWSGWAQALRRRWDSPCGRTGESATDARSDRANAEHELLDRIGRLRPAGLLADDTRSRLRSSIHPPRERPGADDRDQVPDRRSQWLSQSDQAHPFGGSDTDRPGKTAPEDCVLRLEALRNWMRSMSCCSLSPSRPLKIAGKKRGIRP